MFLQVSLCLSTGVGITGTNSLLRVECVGPGSLRGGGGYVQEGVSGGGYLQEEWVPPDTDT